MQILPHASQGNQSGVQSSADCMNLRGHMKQTTTAAENFTFRFGTLTSVDRITIEGWQTSKGIW